MSMKKLSRSFAVVAAILMGGCGPITPQGLLIKGAMWAAKKGVEEQVEDWSKRDHQRPAEDKHRHEAKRQRAASRPAASAEDSNAEAP